ncbi:MAG: hypothetical protein ACD_15C00073G0007 [uncultured bacterium]|nr:MAG: hypothetical protein ACD_15C00073G0007 [uncultured bacterium]HCU70614.1 hypothetical protein [Candidatus Moranbacteria bacterium]
MFNFFKKGSNNQNKKKSKVVRELPKPYACRKVIVSKKKTKTICRTNSFYMKIATWILLLVFFGVTIYILFFSRFLAVNEVEISGLETLSKQELSENISSKMKGKIVGAFSRDNLIFFNSQSAEDDLRENYKIIRDLKISKKFPNKLMVKVHERKSMLVYCVKGECFVVDEEGKIFAKADFNQGKLGENNSIILNDESNKEIETDGFFMEPNFIQFAQDVKNQLDLNDIIVKNIFFTPILVSGDLRVETERGWKIYFNYQLGAKEGMEMLKTVLKNSITEEQLKDLEYVDVRLADKVYYKLRDNAEENSDTDAENPEIEAKTGETKKENNKKKNR